MPTRKISPGGWQTDSMTFDKSRRMRDADGSHKTSIPYPRTPPGGGWQCVTHLSGPAGGGTPGSYTWTIFPAPPTSAPRPADKSIRRIANRMRPWLIREATRVWHCLQVKVPSLCANEHPQLFMNFIKCHVCREGKRATSCLKLFRVWRVINCLVYHLLSVKYCDWQEKGRPEKKFNGCFSWWWEIARVLTLLYNNKTDKKGEVWFT